MGVTTLSLIVAEHFGKRHKNIFQAIDVLESDCGLDFHRLNFQPMTYTVHIGKGVAREDRAVHLSNARTSHCILIWFIHQWWLDDNSASYKAFYGSLYVVRPWVLEHHPKPSAKSRDDKV